MAKNTFTKVIKFLQEYYFIIGIIILILFTLNMYHSKANVVEGLDPNFSIIYNKRFNFPIDAIDDTRNHNFFKFAENALIKCKMNNYDLDFDAYGEIMRRIHIMNAKATFPLYIEYYKYDPSGYEADIEFTLSRFSLHEGKKVRYSPMDQYTSINLINNILDFPGPFNPNGSRRPDPCKNKNLKSYKEYMNEPFRGNLSKSEFVGGTLIDAMIAFGNGVFLDESKEGYYPTYSIDSSDIEETLINLTNYEIMNLFPDYYSKYYPDLEEIETRENPKLKRTIGTGFEVTRETETVKYTPRVPGDLISMRLRNYNNIINQIWLCRFNNWKIKKYMIIAEMTYKNKRSWTAYPDSLKLFEDWNNRRISNLKDMKEDLKGSGPGIKKNKIILQRIIDEYIKDGNTMKQLINTYLQNKEIMNKINSTNNIRESGRTKFKRAAAIGGSTGGITTRVRVEQDRRKRSRTGRLTKNKYYKKARKSMKGLRDRVTRRPRNLMISAETPNRNLPQTINRMRDSAQKALKRSEERPGGWTVGRYSDSLIGGSPRHRRGW